MKRPEARGRESVSSWRKARGASCAGASGYGERGLPAQTDVHDVCCSREDGCPAAASLTVPPPWPRRQTPRPRRRRLRRCQTIDRTAAHARRLSASSVPRGGSRERAPGGGATCLHYAPEPLPQWLPSTTAATADVPRMSLAHCKPAAQSRSATRRDERRTQPHWGCILTSLSFVNRVFCTQEGRKKVHTGVPSFDVSHTLGMYASPAACVGARHRQLQEQVV